MEMLRVAESSRKRASWLEAVVWCEVVWSGVYRGVGGNLLRQTYQP